MSVPKIPMRSPHQVRLDLLESIALEETALAHLINAEAEKVQALAKFMPRPKDFSQAAEMQKIVLAMIQAAQLKELILLQKMREVGKLSGIKWGHHHHSGSDSSSSSSSSSSWSGESDDSSEDHSSTGSSDDWSDDSSDSSGWESGSDSSDDSSGKHS